MDNKAMRKAAKFLFFGFLLFAIQTAGQVCSLLSFPDMLHPAVARGGIEKALASPLFIAETLWYLVLGSTTHAAILFIPAELFSQITKQRNYSRARKATQGTAVALLFSGLLLLWNNVLFPFSNVLPALYVANIVPVYCYTFLFIALLAAWIGKPPYKSKLLIIPNTLLLLFLPSLKPAPRLQTRQPNQPNVILIGLDSLRPDHVFVTSGDTSHLMPSLETWLSEAVVYDDAITPMARTFPALTSLLTAQYPALNGARINLTGSSQINLDWTLAKHLKEKGYITAFAIDGARFVNIDREYGFDILQTPQQGLPDFVLGDLIDSVGTNLLNLFPIAMWLNPVQYGNGAASGSYRPEQFDYILGRLLKKLPTTSTLLMTHFDLAHLPYVRTTAFSTSIESALSFETYTPYKRALRATDTQFKHFMRTLKASGFLENAVVAVYSDHGEEFSFDKDHNFRKNNNLLSGRLGHGSSIFAPSQNRILMAVQHFRNGIPQLTPGFNSKPALLTDIGPTILHRLEENLDLPENLNGIDLGGQVPPSRIRYIESSILFPNVASSEVDRANLLRQFGDFFYVNDSLRIRANENVSSGHLKQLGALILGKVVGIAEMKPSAREGIISCPSWRTVIWPGSRSNRKSLTKNSHVKDKILSFFNISSAACTSL